MADPSVAQYSSRKHPQCSARASGVCSLEDINQRPRSALKKHIISRTFLFCYFNNLNIKFNIMYGKK